MKPDRAAPFFAGVWAGTAPMLVWASHFAGSYVGAAVVCASAVKSGAGEPDALRRWLIAATALALIALATMLWRSRTRSAQAAYVQMVRRACATLALIGVAWTGVPLALMPACAT